MFLLSVCLRNVLFLGAGEVHVGADPVFLFRKTTLAGVGRSRPVRNSGYCTSLLISQGSSSAWLN